MKKIVGIIANPESGRDIRRLVSQASVFDNMEKVSIVRRLLTTVEKFGIRDFLVMPDTFGIVKTALNTLEDPSKFNVEFLSMKINGDWKDTYEAAKLMRGRVGALIVIGGDGTNRVVAKAVDDIPIMPISTGTNNVFPYMIEATIAGEAVAAVVSGVVDKDECGFKAKRLEVLKDDSLLDIALVDIAVTTHSFVGSKAVWKPEYIKEVIVTTCNSYNIGLSSIGGSIKEIDEEEDEGLYVKLGSKNFIRAPIAPGMVREVGIDEFKVLKIGEKVKVETIPSLLAFDGERELMVKNQIFVKLSRNGPIVIDYKKTLKIASKRGFLKIK